VSGLVSSARPSSSIGKKVVYNEAAKTAEIPSTLPKPMHQVAETT
jgi:hypothetical protein